MSFRSFKIEATCTAFLFIFVWRLVDTANLLWSAYRSFRTGACRSLVRVV